MQTIAKIAFNYVRGRDFDEVRNFIRHGVTPADVTLVVPSNKPSLYGDEKTFRQTNAHLVSVEWMQRSGGFARVVRVSLFNGMTACCTQKCVKFFTCESSCVPNHPQRDDLHELGIDL